jgi:SAM-dependent methyltransferase
MTAHDDDGRGNNVPEGAGRLAQLRRDWSRLAEEDPLWAVCVDPGRRGGRWDLDEFMASGQAEIGVAMDRLGELGRCQSRDSALDFGCGVGRLTAALSGYFGSVTGVDIAEPMLARASSLLADRPSCRLVHNDSPQLAMFADATFDLVYSSLVLQHMPADLAAGYLREFIRVVRPGGAVVIVVPQAHRMTPGGAVYAYAPGRLISLIQRKIFRYPAPMQMHTMPARRVAALAQAAGAGLVASDPRSGVGEHWRMTCHVIAR